MRNLKTSYELEERALKVIPGASQTFSKGPNQWARGVSPLFLKKGEGAWVWDVDGNKYLDHLMALGPITLGYNHKGVNDAVCAQLQDGAIFSQMHPLETEVAELICDLVPCAESVRFAKNGSDVTTAAVRAARAYTGREHIAFCGYHGWHDWHIATTTRDLGIPNCVKELSHTFTYNDIRSLEALFERYPDQLAAVMLEPIGVVEPEPGFLESVKQLCERHGTVLIFDEIVTGFRFDLGGAQSLFNVSPDLVCLGKGIANGLPLSAVAGKREIMSIFNDIFFSGTFGGDTLALAAAKATIESMQRDDTISQIWNYGEQLLDFLQAQVTKHNLSQHVAVLGLPPRSVVAFPHQDEAQTLIRRTFFMQEAVKRGLLYFCSHIPSAAHGEYELEFTKSVLTEVFDTFAEELRNGLTIDSLDGPPVEAIFRKA